MNLTNAERQKRWRAKRNALAQRTERSDKIASAVRRANKMLRIVLKDAERELKNAIEQTRDDAARNAMIRAHSLVVAALDKA